MRITQLIGMAAGALLALLLTIQSAAAEGRWLRAESTNFVVYSEGAERDLLPAVRDLERFDAVLRRLLPPPSTETGSRLEIYMLDGRRSLEQIWPGGSDVAAGFYTATPNLVAAIATRGGERRWAREILFHEYTHHYMRQHFLQPFPRWFTEGLAVFLQTTRLEAERAIVGEYSEAFAFLLTGGGWLSGEEVFGSTPRDFSRIENSQFYAQSWLAVSYLQTSSEGNARLERYLTAIRNGANVDAAFEPAFGVTISDFHSELRTYARGVFPTLAVPVTALPAQAIQTTRLPEAADDLLLLTLRMRRSPAEEEIADIATRVEAAAARHPTDPYALRARAQAALMQKNAAGARAILGTLLAASPQDHEALYLMGSSYVIEASLPDQADPAAIAQQGRRYFARAFRIAPNHYQTLYAYARTFPLPLETATLDVLVRAHLLAPQVSEISINTAQALMLAGRHTEAVPLLQAVVYAPHREASESLRALLAAAQRGEPPPSSSETEDNDDE